MGQRKKSESPTGIEPMAFRTLVGRFNHWAELNKIVRIQILLVVNCCTSDKTLESAFRSHYIVIMIIMIMIMIMTIIHKNSWGLISVI